MTEEKVRKAKNDRMLKEVYICYDCGKRIHNLKDLVEKKVVLSVTKDKLVTRSFHIPCMLSFNERSLDMPLSQQEDSDWDNAYQYFKKEYLGLDDWKEMHHAVQRMRGLRVGKYVPSGDNVKFLKRGYPYDTIYKAMIIAKPKAMIIASGVTFKDLKHKVDFFMKFVTAEVEDVQMRIDKMNKANEASKKASLVNDNVEYRDHEKEYKEMVERQKQQQESKEAEPKTGFLNSLWGDVLDDEEG